MSNLWTDFKKFLMQGDLVAIAVAFILAGAFKSVVDSLVADVVTPIIGGVFGQTELQQPHARRSGSVRIAYGWFLNSIISFVIIGAVLFVIVKAYERAKSLRSKEEVAEDPDRARRAHRDPRPAGPAAQRLIDGGQSSSMARASRMPSDARSASTTASSTGVVVESAMSAA